MPSSSILHDEIFEQPDALRRALAGGRDAAVKLAAEAKRRDVRYLVLAARGTSDHAATYAQYLFQIACGLPVALAAPSVHTLFDARVGYRDALVIGVSQSGAGEDIVEVVSQARAAGALTAAITNTEGSKLAQAAEHVLLCNAGVERAVAATKTYTTTLALFALLAALWSEDAGLEEKLGRVAEHTQATLERTEAPVEALAQTLIHAERLLTIARGLHLPTAAEAALKIAETTYTATRAFSSADLLHGPIASVAVQTPCVLFEPKGKTEKVMGEVAAKLRERGARVLRFAAGEGADVPLTDPGDELLSPLVDILPAQLLAYHLTVARGLDPDNPRGLSKVTITR
jgi:glucosamine--fructose-6-phosphate aminotransferase (isomerizing)